MKWTSCFRAPYLLALVVCWSAGMRALASAPSNAMTITGADPTCRTDSSEAIDKGIAAAAAAGRPAYLPPGCYAHNTLITVDGAKLYGAGDSTELRSTAGIKTYKVEGWSIDQSGTVTLTLRDNRDFAAGSPANVAGLTGFQCSGDPNGPNETGVIISESKASYVKYRPKTASCRAGSGQSGTVTNVAPLTAIVLKGDGAELHDIKATVLWSGGRTGLFQSTAVLNRASNFIVDHVHVIGSGGAPGFDCVGCTHGMETHNIVENSKADGMAHEGCASFVTNSDNRAVATGDDSYSVDSYGQDACASHDITFTRDDSINSINRGYDVGGGVNITFTGGSIVNAQNACIILISGSPQYKSKRTDSITITGTTLNGCAKTGIWIAAEAGGEATTSNINISNVHGTGIGWEGVHIGEPGGTVAGVHISNCTFASASSGSRPAVFFAPAPKEVSNVQFQGVTFRGFGQKCISDPGGRSSSAVAGVAINCDGKTISDMRQAMRPQ